MSELGIYFRIKRDDHWDNLDILDLTEDELRETLEERNQIWLINLVMILLKTIKDDD